MAKGASPRSGWEHGLQANQLARARALREGTASRFAEQAMVWLHAASQTSACVRATCLQLRAWRLNVLSTPSCCQPHLALPFISFPSVP